MKKLKRDAGCMQHWPIDSDWTKILAPHFDSDSFLKLVQFVELEREAKTIFPEAKHVFRAFEFSSFERTKVVILGQDPYHGPGQAHGLSFSVADGQKLPPSLKNIFKELKSDLGIENTTGDLSQWAQQGVLLLNTVLTVENGKAHSHKNHGWEEFTDVVIEQLGRREKPVVFVLWGNHATKKARKIGSNHFTITSSHPSPLSAHRGFFGSQPFSKTNTALRQFNESPIAWETKAS